MVQLAAALAERRCRVDLVLCRTKGPYLARVPASVHIVALRRSVWFPLCLARTALRDIPALLMFTAAARRILETLPFLPSLARYLRREQPVALLASKPQANLAAIWAARLASTPTRVVTWEHNHLPSKFAHLPGWRYLAGVVRRNYAKAAARTAVSNGVAEGLAEWAGVPRNSILTIYNGVVNDELIRRADAPIDHPWFQPNSPPVILAAGRLAPQKDLATLLRAFAQVRQRRPARLVILGEGPLRAALDALARRLGIAADLAMPGFVPDPVAYMKRSAVFALSSVFEGLPTVLIEALAAGCPIVSTDCPTGPAEILAGGDYGRLVSVGDSRAFAAALCAALDEPPRQERLRQRAGHFSTDRMAEQHLQAMVGAEEIERS